MYPLYFEFRTLYLLLLCDNYNLLFIAYFTGIGSWGACQHYYRPPPRTGSAAGPIRPDDILKFKPFIAPSIYVKIDYFHKWIKEHEKEKPVYVSTYFLLILKHKSFLYYHIFFKKPTKKPSTYVSIFFTYFER